MASNRWLPSPTRKIFNLAIIKKERIQHGVVDNEFIHDTIRGKVDDILLKKSPIQLQMLFTNIEGERKVILIDGAPGSGKSTLTVHVCQKWSRGELFQEFIIVVLVQLQDPAVQNAQSIADLIPCPSLELANQVAREIEATLGRGVLWVLDGWDELPLHLREKSLLRDMIKPSLHSSITQSSVIVTSRPVSSGELSELVSSRIEVLGFTWEEQRQYFTECLKGDTKAVDTLMERLSENPAIEGSCYLPLNASIVAHLYLSDGSLPYTAYGIFSSLVQHCLSHYLCERLGKTQQEARLTSLDSLPRELQGPFNDICKLAFSGILQNKITFSQNDIEISAGKDSAVVCEIGLLQATPSILSDGRTVYYNFIHLSIQEMLSAIYISHMPASKQMSTFESLFSDSRFSAVFQFYAAITKLHTSRPFLSKVIYRWFPIPTGMLDIVGKIIRKQRNIMHGVPKPLLVSLLHCVFEAQDQSLCQFVAQEMGSELNLSYTSLTPVDSLAIGYFLYSVSLTTSTSKEFNVDLLNCSLRDAGTKSLMQSICRRANPQSSISTYINMNLWNNEIHEQGASHIADILGSTSTVSKLWLASNPIGDRGLQTISTALKHNKSLKCLSIPSGGLSDTGIASLADVLYVNNTLETLLIDGHRALTENELKCLIEAVSSNSGVVKLYIPDHSRVAEVRKKVNEARKKNGLPKVDVY